MLTEQEIFSRVAAHLLLQNKKSFYSPDNVREICAYRGEGGTKCAVGCLLEDDEYRPYMEDKGVDRLLSLTPDGFRNFGVQNHNLLCDLQYIHDYMQPVEWKTALGQVAMQYGLQQGGV